MVICDVQPATCDKGTRSGDQCLDLYYGDGNFEFDQQLRRCASDPKPKADAGVTPLAPTSSDNGGCRYSRPRPGLRGTAAFLALVSFVSAYRRTRRGRARQRSRTNRRTS
jgi:hypothetical protein